MSDIYVNLTYEEYKSLELQCRAFRETVHGEGTDWYHKAIRLRIGDLTMEFHGPNVKARIAAADAASVASVPCDRTDNHVSHYYNALSGPGGAGLYFCPGITARTG